MIDTHVHFWKYSPDAFSWITGDLAPIAKDMLAEDLWLQLPKKIEGVIAVQARPCHDENIALQEWAHQHDKIKGIMGWLDFEEDVDRQLEQLRSNPAFKGFRHMLQDEKDPSSYMLYHQKFNRGVQKLQKEQFLYSLLIRQQDLSAAVEFCQRHDQYELMIDHLAKPIIYSDTDFDEWKRQMQWLVPLRHVNLKISGLVTEGGANSQAIDFRLHLDTVMDLFGPERLVWGSDWPVSFATHDYATLMEFWLDWTRDWSETERLQVEEATPKRVYKLR